MSRDEAYSCRDEAFFHYFSVALYDGSGLKKIDTAVYKRVKWIHGALG